jgi:hypothetical protein
MEEVNLLPGPSQNNGDESSNSISSTMLNNSYFFESTSSFQQSNSDISRILERLEFCIIELSRNTNNF